MSAPNYDKPDEGIAGKISNSAKNAANYVTESVKGTSKEASKEANKEQMKGNAGDTSLGGRASGAWHAAGDKVDQTKHDTSADANKRAV
jgi:hypothetical protein